MDHARCSESLPLFLRGELEPARADAVRRHLEVCDECSAERRALEVLGAAAVEPLSTVERNRIHAAIETATVEEQTQTVLAPAGKPLWARLAPALAGVATLLLIAVGAMFLGDAGTGLDSAGQDAGSAEGGGGEGAVVEDPEALQGTARDDAEETVVYAGDIGKVTVSSLSRDTLRRRFVPRRAAETNSAFSEPAEAAGGDAAEPEASDEATKRKLADDNLQALRAQADIAVGRQIADCARSVASAVPYETVPVYAATATLEGERVLLMGFNWAKRGGRELDRFMLWGWPIGDCRIPVFYGSSGPPKQPQE